MPKTVRTEAELAFHELIETGDVELIDDGPDLQIAGDTWTLGLDGDPPTTAFIALDDEEGDPEAALRSSITEEAVASIREFDARLDGTIIDFLAKSPDPMARSLAGLLRG